MYHDVRGIKIILFYYLKDQGAALACPGRRYHHHRRRGPKGVQIRVPPPQLWVQVLHPQGHASACRQMRVAQRMSGGSDSQVQGAPALT